MADFTPSASTEAARDIMVDGQLRPTNVTNALVLDAMRALPREAFLPARLRNLAYIDDCLKLTPTRAMMTPLALARLIQLAAPLPGETALVVGAGPGYGAAVLAACGVHVTALEQDETLLELARQAAAQVVSNPPVSWVSGKLADGVPDRAPYDLILIEGAVRAIPDRIARQVAQNGRLVTVLAPPRGTGVAVIAEPTTDGLSERRAFDTGAPLLPELLPAAAFAF
jgi:protein-L-isoaspartate(D-aspartate) O-methyltransferase